MGPAEGPRGSRRGEAEWWWARVSWTAASQRGAWSAKECSQRPRVRGEGAPDGTWLASEYINQPQHVHVGDETYDAVQDGVRLILNYDVPSSAFVGTLENTTLEFRYQVRVEVHLSNGTELGPTTPIDLNPSQLTGVSLVAAGTDFDRWSAHAEIGESEGGDGGDGGDGGGDGGHDDGD